MSDEKKENRIIVEGFCFTNQAEAEQARKEAEGVKYIREKTDMDNPEMVLQIYNKMIQQKLFETAVGFSYLKDLQEYLQSIPFIRNEDIFPIQVQHPSLEQHLRQKHRLARKKKPVKKQTTEINMDYKKRYRVTFFISAVLFVCIIAMFVITATTNNATILNYENEIINKYENWEQELNEREDAVKEKEQALGITRSEG